MHTKGIIGHRDIINRLVDESLTKPHGAFAHNWIYCEPRTGKPHGDSPTICTNIVVNWLRENSYKCKYVVYIPPGCGIGGALYADKVFDDRDFIEPHTSLRGQKKHEAFVEGKEEQYLNYVRYLLKEFPNLYILPYHTYVGEGSPILPQLLKAFPKRVIDPHIFDKAEEAKYIDTEKIVEEFVKKDPQFVKRIKKEVSRVITRQHRDLFHGSLRLEFLPQHTEKSVITFTKMDGLLCTCFDSGYFQMALRHYISLRTLGQYCGKCFAILSGKDEWQQWQLDILKKLHVDYVIDTSTLSRPYVLARFLLLKEQLRNRYPDFTGPTLFLDTDIWFQDNFEELIELARSKVCFSTWHGHAVLEQSQFAEYRQKYMQVLAKSTPLNKGVQWLQPDGGIPHGGCHGGPFVELLKRYDALEEYLRQGLLKNDRTEDEIGLFLSCKPNEDDFRLSRFCSIYPTTIDLVTRKITDFSGEVKPILHFENNQKVSSLADFFIVYPDILSRAIEQFDLHELKEQGRLTAWHLRTY